MRAAVSTASRVTMKGSDNTGKESNPSTGTIAYVTSTENPAAVMARAMDDGCGTNHTPPTAMAVSRALKEAMVSSRLHARSGRSHARRADAVTAPTPARRKPMRLCTSNARSKSAPGTMP